MTDEAQQAKEHDEPSSDSELIVKLRDDMAADIAAMKTTYESQIAEMKKSLEDLSKQNTDLQRALVRSASIPQQTAEPPKTEEQLYAENVERCRQRVKELLQ